MTYLDCSVTGCVYNKDYSCSKNEIMVEGKEAEEKRSTCCGSFREKESNHCGCSNVTQEPKKETNVCCEACHCRFNENNKCEATHIGIAGGNACTCGETECASFECCC